MFESFILGMVQGIAEWLPISSEAMIVLVKNNFFPGGIPLSAIISYAIFLHLGTLLAALVYFHTKILKLIRNILRYPKLIREEKSELNFIVITTLISGCIGIVLLKVIEYYESFFTQTLLINALVAIFLFVTAGLLYFTESRKGNQTVTTITTYQGIITGIFQGFSALPGISRSGSTIAAMGLVGIEKKRALELSFILSIPLVLGANIFLNIKNFSFFGIDHLVALLSAFVFGIATIHLLLSLVERIKFSMFVGMFGLLLLIVTVIEYLG